MNNVTVAFFRWGIVSLVALMAVRAMAEESTTPAAQQITVKSGKFTGNHGRIYDTDGRLREDILYTAAAGNARVFFGKDRVSYVLVKTDARMLSLQEAVATGKPTTQADRGRPTIGTVELYRVDLEFAGAKSDMTVEGGERSSSVVNFYNTPDGKHIEAAEYGTVIYRNVYDNIDIVFRLDNGRLKYDFVVKPGGRVGDIQLRYNGAEKVEVKDGGMLQVHTPLGTIAERIPAAFALDADDHKKNVDVVFHSSADNTIGFYHDRYDNSQSLVIDPAVEFSTYFGGSDLEGVLNIGRQNTGYNFYAIGYSYSIDFPASVGAYQAANAGNADAFIFKIDEDGNRLWATYYGGSSNDEAQAMNYDSNNDMIVVGGTYSSNLPGVTGSSFQPALAGGQDAFIAKFNNSGSLLWATYYGGTGDEMATGVYTNGTLQIFVTGFTTSVTTGLGAFPINQPLPAGLGGSDGFLLKFSSAGARILSRRFGGGGNDIPTAIMQRNTEVFVAGYTNTLGPVFSPPTTGALQTTNAGDFDIFVSKFNNLSFAPTRTTFFGGNDYDGLPFMSGKNGMDVLVSFTTFSTNVPVTATAIQPTKAGGYDAFIAAIDYTIGATSLLHATYFGGSDLDEGRGIIENGPFGMTFMTGVTTSVDMPTTLPALFPGHTAPCFPGDQDGFLLQLSPEYKLVSSSYFGGCDADYGQQLLTGRCEKCLYLVGTTFSSDFMTTPLAFQPAYTGMGDGFFLKLNIEPSLLIQAAGSTTILTGGSVGLFVVPAPVYSTFSWLQWYRDGQPVTGATLTSMTATRPGRYYLVGNSLNPECPMHYSNVIEVKYGCSDDIKINYSSYYSARPYRFPIGVTTITTTASYNGYAFGKVIISSGATVNILNTVILAQSCSEIVVERGGILRVTGSTIQGCNDWHGITVYGNPALPHGTPGTHGEVYIEGCTISDADVAVYSVDGGFLDVEHTVFFGNRHCIALEPYMFQHLSPIRDNWFDATDLTPYACFTPPFAAANRPMVYANGVSDMPIDNNKFYGDFFSPAVAQVNGLEARNSQIFHVFNNRFEGALYTAMSFSTTASITLGSNRVGESIAMHPQNGIVFDQSSGDIINLNSLYRCNNGMQYYTTMNTPATAISRNLFENGNFGLVISTDEHPVDAPFGANGAGNTLDITMYCNKFVHNQTGILGSGNLVMQGTLADEANNMFSLNRNWDLIWQGAAGTNFYQGSTVNPSLPLNLGLQSPYTMNGLLQLSNDLAVQLNVSLSSSCRGSWIVTSAEEPVQSNETIRLYPNPFTDEMTVDISGRPDMLYTVEIVDIFGRRVYSAELNEGGSTRLAPNVPASGMYMVRVYRNGEEIRSIPVVNIGK